MVLAWTEVNNLNTARVVFGNGTGNTNALVLVEEMEVQQLTETETWNGSSLDRS